MVSAVDIAALDRRKFLTVGILSSVAALLPSESFAAETTIPIPTIPIPIPTTTTIAATPDKKRNTSFEEAVSGFAAGATLSAVKTGVKYPLDTATVRLQRPETPYSLRDLPALFDGSLRGIATPLLSNIPGGAVFFAVKDFTKSALRGSGLPPWLVTSLAVAAGQPPYWAVRNPSEVVKTRQQAGSYGPEVGVVEAFRRTYDDGALYAGYGENMGYALPADIIKFVVYDGLTKGRSNTGNKQRRLSPFEGAVSGALATAVAQVCTTPLDVVRNRVMMAEGGGGGTGGTAKPSYWESLTTIAAEEGLSGLFAGTSPRIGKAILSGAIQFATYEETKAKIGGLFDGKR